MFDAAFDAIATVMGWFYDLWPSYGMAIVFLTLAVMLFVTPLTLKGTRSMLELQQHQPELRRIQQQYKDDRQKMNEEMMKFYQEHKINPVGGCLPLLIQLPVFIVLYNVIQGLTKRTSLIEAVVRSSDAAQAGTFEPKYLDESTALFRSLHANHEMVSWGIDLSRSAVQAVGEGLGTAWPYVLLIIGATATSYVQQMQIQGRSQSSQMNPQMQAITRIMPLFITFISLTLPAALVVYFFVSGLYRVGQQAIITRHIYHPHQAKLAATGAAPIEASARPADTGPRKGLLERLMPPAPAADVAGNNGGTAKPERTTKPVAETGPRTSGRVTPPGAGQRRPAKRKKRK